MSPTKRPKQVDLFVAPLRLSRGDLELLRGVLRGINANALFHREQLRLLSILAEIDAVVAQSPDLDGGR